MTIRSIFIALITIFTVFAGPAGASAQQWLATFNFNCIESTLSGNSCSSGGDKLNLMITNMGPYSDYDVRFTFLNSWTKGNMDSIITGITFIDNPASPTILDYSKSAISIGTDVVDFSPDNEEYTTFSSSTDEKGLNLEESVSIKYALTDATDAENDLKNLVDAIGDSSLSIQLTVQMIGTQGSGSGTFLLNSTGEGPVPIPEPATMLLLGTGLVGIAAVTRKRFNIT